MEIISAMSTSLGNTGFLYQVCLSVNLSPFEELKLMCNARRE